MVMRLLVVMNLTFLFPERFPTPVVFIEMFQGIRP